MVFRIIKLLILNFLFIFCWQVSAQDVYRAEIGLTGGGAYYLGDANNVPFRNTQFNYGGFLRYKFSPRIALRAEINSTKIAGEYPDANNINNSIPFENSTIYAADLCGEFNFFDFEQSKNNRLSKLFSPYIFAGLGVMSDMYAGQTFPEASTTFGIGFKLKLVKRWNLNIQWSNRLLLFSDQIEGVDVLNNPTGLNGTNIFNNDMLSTLTIGVSYDIWKKTCDCNNSATSVDKHKYKKRSQ